MIETLESKSFLESVNNIIFKNDMGQIIQTAYQQQAEQKIILMGRKYGTNVTFKISPDSIVNVHLEPYKKCYWNKCTFCGINKKYHYNEELSSERLIFQLDNLKNYILKNHIRYVWFIDEAIKPEKLKIIANYILENNLSFLWQVRCRIEEELMKDNLPHLLAKSGLREIRLGLESGSKSVLKHMNKFPEEFDFTIIEKIVSMYNSLGISVHTPIIVGYPEETFSDRQKTYELLSHLKKKYTLFSFNINILGLDISSKLFKEWYKYNIDKIDFPCAPDEYMGNIINWKSSSFNYEQLDEERNNFMRDNLYPWMPHNTLVKPYLFYRLSETIRNTLIWKTLNTNATMIMNEDATFICSHNIVIIPRENDNHYILYQWDSHHYLIANQLFISILKLFDNPITVESGIYLIISNITDKYSYDDLVKTLHKLIAFNFLELVQSERQFKGSTSITLKEYYDKIYSTEDFPYAVKQDNWLTHYGKQIPIGTVLELGVGNGKNIPMLLKKGYKVKGIDISSVAINQLHLKYMRSNCCFEQADICDYNIQPNSYELIVCSMVLHYLEYDKLHEVAQKIQNGLKRNGYLFISVLSKRDPLYKVSQMENPFVKTFFNCESLTALFGKLQIVEISDDYSLEPLRKHPANYFGTILYLGKKS